MCKPWLEKQEHITTQEIETSTLSQRRGRAPQPSIMWGVASQGGQRGSSTTTTTTQTWLRKNSRKTKNQLYAGIVNACTSHLCWSYFLKEAPFKKLTGFTYVMHVASSQKKHCEFTPGSHRKRVSASVLHVSIACASFYHRKFQGRRQKSAWSRYLRSWKCFQKIRLDHVLNDLLDGAARMVRVRLLRGTA